MPVTRRQRKRAALALATDLPAELVVQVAKAGSTTPNFLATVGALCHSWRAVILADADLAEDYWRAATMARFPKVLAIVAAQSSTLSWLEIYKLQQRSEKFDPSQWFNQDEHDPSDFVISIEISVEGQVVLAETHELPSWHEQNDDKCIDSRPLWDEDTLPQWVETLLDWRDIRLSVYITREMKTVPICENEPTVDANDEIWRVMGDITFGAPGHDIVPLAPGVALDVDFCHRTGVLRCRPWDEDKQANLQVVHALRAFQAMLDRV
jgi:hypothetical protein